MPPRRGAEAHWSVVGTTRSGKTTAARMMVRRIPRYVVIDPKGSFDDLGTVCESYEACLDYLDRHRSRKTLRLVVGAPDVESNLAAISYLWKMHETFDLPPTALVMDEAHRWTPGGRYPTEADFGRLAVAPRGKSYLELIYTEGLQHKIVALTVTQFPQQLPTQVRSLSDHKVAFRMTSRLPEDFRHAFGGREEELAALEKLKPGTDPAKGVHYLTYPEDLDLLGDWRRELHV